MAARQRPPDRRRRGAHRRRGAVDPCRARSRLRARPACRCSPPTAPGCSIASAPVSPRPARRWSKRESTPPATAWRSTICSSPTRAARAMATRATAPGWCAAVEAALDGDAPAPPAPPPMSRREEAFAVAPSVLIADKASTRTTVIEVNARDRPGLLAGLAHAIHASGHTLHSAHIATYGERAVDVFYVTDGDGHKLGPDADRRASRGDARGGRLIAHRKRAPPTGEALHSQFEPISRAREPAPARAAAHRPAAAAEPGRPRSPGSPIRRGRSALPAAAAAAAARHIRPARRARGANLARTVSP